MKIWKPSRQNYCTKNTISEKTELKWNTLDVTNCRLDTAEKISEHEDRTTAAIKWSTGKKNWTKK